MASPSGAHRKKNKSIQLPLGILLYFFFQLVIGTPSLYKSKALLKRAYELGPESQAILHAESTLPSKNEEAVPLLNTHNSKSESLDRPFESDSKILEADQNKFQSTVNPIKEQKTTPDQIKNSGSKPLKKAIGDWYNESPSTIARFCRALIRYFSFKKLENRELKAAETSLKKAEEGLKKAAKKLEEVKLQEANKNNKNSEKETETLTKNPSQSAEMKTEKLPAKSTSNKAQVHHADDASDSEKLEEQLLDKNSEKELKRKTWREWYKTSPSLLARVLRTMERYFNPRKIAEHRERQAKEKAEKEAKKAEKAKEESKTAGGSEDVLVPAEQKDLSGSKTAREKISSEVTENNEKIHNDGMTQSIPDQSFLSKEKSQVQSDSNAPQVHPSINSSQ